MVLVTGATGFVGRHVVRRLSAEKVPVRLMAHHQPPGRTFAGLDVQVVRGNVNDPAALEAACAGCDAVVHLVAIIRERGKATFQAINHQGTRNVLAAARKAGVQRFVHMSAIGAQDNPRFPYLRGKWQGEQAVVQSGIPYVILRASIVFGPGDEFVTRLADLVLRLPIVPIIGAGGNKFQPIHAQDVAECVSHALAREALTGQTVEIGGPEHLTYDQVVDVIMETLGKRRRKLHLPLALMRPLVWAGERIVPNFPVTTPQLAMISLDNVTALDSVAGHFGFQPRSLRGNLAYLLGERESRRAQSVVE